MISNLSYLENNIYNYEYFAKDDVCRLCWKREAIEDIHQVNQTEEQLSEKIKYCLDITIEIGSVPKKICSNCLTNIENFLSFKKLCNVTNSRLKEVRGIQAFVNTYCVKEAENDDIKIEIHDNHFNNDITSHDSDDEPILKNKNTIEQRRKYTKKTYPKTYCKNCRSDYKNSESLTEHNVKIHGITPDGIYNCHGCDKKFTSKRVRMSHEIAICKGLKNGYLCAECNRYLPKRSMYENHTLKHLLNHSIDLPKDLFKCLKCKKTFDNMEDLKIHLDKNHNKKKHFVCELCGRVFNRLDYLNKHMMAHVGIKKHICPHCGYRATQKSSLNVHLRKHTGNRPYSCDQCPLKCISSSNLLAHKQRHTGLKKYECKLCPKKFGYKCSLEEHVASTHDRLKCFTCEICNTSYSRVGGLRRHIRQKHKNDKRVENEDGTLENRDKNGENCAETTMQSDYSNVNNKLDNSEILVKTLNDTFVCRV